MKRLPDSELDIMIAIWKLGTKATRMEIEGALSNSGEWSATTILSLLSRLEKKGFVKVEKNGKQNIYEALISQENYLQEESKSVLEKMYNNSITNFMVALYSGKKPSKKQLNELQDLIDGFKEEN
ncbi:MAG: BlaI/MecI/CopY family transcriptional regulator [Lachnospiraceae bacterium]|nr:BlaI/MecI/CopY family transcriptional regulator [Lachnospiraceae bacterium]MBE5957924.1 BlaI/MecI/CopY family transcriptional regulator [Lachnospiraceae bacterium]